VDAATSSYAASRGLSPEGETPRDPVREVRAQIVLVLRNTWDRILRKIGDLGGLVRVAAMLTRRRRSGQSKSDVIAPVVT
jgi:hypothetical protein